MKIPLKLIFVALPLLVIGVVSWYLQHSFKPFQEAGGKNCLPGSPCDRKQFFPQNGRSGSLITDIRLFQFEGVHTQWILNGQSAQDIGEEQIVIQKPSLTVYQKSGESASITSAEGLVDSHSQAMVFTGGVVATNGTLHLSTEILRFDPSERILYTKQKFLLVDGPLRLEGIGLTLNQKTRRLEVTHRVKVQMMSSVGSLPNTRAGGIFL